MLKLRARFLYVVGFVRKMFKAFSEDDTFYLGAALAYYTIFSIIPLLVVVIAVSGMMAGEDAVRGQVFSQLHGLVGDDTADALQSMVGEAYLSGKGLMATVVGLITLVIGATGIFNALKNALNRMWENPAQAQEQCGGLPLLAPAVVLLRHWPRLPAGDHLHHQLADHGLFR